MTNPFPGMNPYLEGRWDDVHARLCMYACNALQPQVVPALVARVGERTLVTSLSVADPGEYNPDADAVIFRPVYPDVRVTEQPGGTAVVGGVVAELAESVVVKFGDDPRTEGFVTIVDPRSGNAVVTVIEFLSASNKLPGPNREQYALKRHERYKAGVNLVEIDLLRRGPWPFAFPANAVPRRHRQPYRACVHRGRGGDEYVVHPMPLDRRLPAIPIPLRRGDPDAVLDLQPLVDAAYVDGAYGIDLDYAADADPPLSGDPAAWADGVLRAAGRRR